ncbi:unnamed protein product [Rotaria magnacalcarata]|nr:unnamed protein product [Rotaria magnacalcarata]
MNFSSTITPSLLIIADSHGKCLAPTIITPHYRVQTCSISGLQWNSKYDNNLSLFSLIQTDTFASLLSTTSNILFLVGINSVRYLPAANVLQQIDQFLISLFSSYSHLTQGKIIITTCLPCLKPSTRYPNIHSLRNNIEHYNHSLYSLSIKKNFRVFDLSLSPEWLGYDGLHINPIYRNHFANILLDYINQINIS